MNSKEIFTSIKMRYNFEIPSQNGFGYLEELRGWELNKVKKRIISDEVINKYVDDILERCKKIHSNLKWDKELIISAVYMFKLNKIAEYTTAIDRLFELRNKGVKILLETNGKTPSESFHILIRGFLKNYKTKMTYDSLQELPRENIFSSNVYNCSRSWKELHNRLRNTALVVSTIDCRTEFWYPIADLIYIIPRSRCYSDSLITKDEVQCISPKGGWVFGICELCWRIVPFNPKAKKRVMCYIHQEIPSTHSYYRFLNRCKSRIRLELMKEEQYISIIDTVFDRVKKFGNKVSALELVKSDESPYPQIAKYLSKAIMCNEKNNIFNALNCSMSIQEEGVTGASIPSYYRIALEEFENMQIEEESCLGLVNYGGSIGLQNMILVEIWLEVMNQDGRSRNNR